VPIKKAGAYQLRAALRDHGSEHVGSASQFIEVPDIKKNRLAVSGILLTATDPTTTKKQSAAGGSAAVDKSPEGQNAEASDKVNAHTAATRQFKRGQILEYSFEVYNAHLDKVTSQPHLTTQMRLFRDGTAVFTGREIALDAVSQADLKRIIFGGAVRLGGDMAPGEYVFQILVTDALAEEKHRVATQWIDFEVVR